MENCHRFCGVELKARELKLEHSEHFLGFYRRIKAMRF
jgi:hypothetical protein